MAFPESGPDDTPGIMPPNEGHLERQIIASVGISGPPPSGGVIISNQRQPFIIREYNPEWISIDIRVFAETDQIPQTVTLTGEVWHECVPEPSAALLLGLAAGGLVIRRRRRS